MCFVKEKYKIKGWTGKIYGLTAKDLYERVLQDSQSDYNWIASASELVRTCNDPTFPERYAQDIKRIILNCFANLELKRGYTGETAAMIAVYDCYHSLPNTEEMFIKTKRKFLNAIITATTQYTKSSVRFPIHPGPTYHKICEEWIKTKLDECISKERIDFPQLRDDLHRDFEETIKKADEDGCFRKDDNEYYQSSLKALRSFISKDIGLYD